MKTILTVVIGTLLFAGIPCAATKPKFHRCLGTTAYGE